MNKSGGTLASESNEKLKLLIHGQLERYGFLRTSYKQYLGGQKDMFQTHGVYIPNYPHRDMHGIMNTHETRIISSKYEIDAFINMHRMRVSGGSEVRITHWYLDAIERVLYPEQMVIILLDGDKWTRKQWLEDAIDDGLYKRRNSHTVRLMSTTDFMHFIETEKELPEVKSSKTHVNIGSVYLARIQKEGYRINEDGAKQIKVKIGFSEKTDEREFDLRRGNDELKIINTFINLTERYENILHNKFSHQKIEREIFWLSNNDIEWIRTNIYSL